jgi:ABC-type branched-subunit amino acid transport system ATPase component
VISVKNIVKEFGGVRAVDGCSFTVRPGTITSIIGPNGAGKTTMFNIVCGIIRADAGRVFLGVTDITNKPTYLISQLGVSRTFQQARLFKNLTVRDNLLMARPCKEKEISDALRSVHFPLSPDVKTSSLSFGQQRLIEIARARLLPHKILLLDEPTAGVNPKVRQELKRILAGLRAKGSTVVLIEHDMDFVMSISDDVIVMAEGKVLCQGPPAKVQKEKRVLEAYLGK